MVRRVLLSVKGATMHISTHIKKASKEFTTDYGQATVVRDHHVVMINGRVKDHNWKAYKMGCFLYDRMQGDRRTRRGH